VWFLFVVAIPLLGPFAFLPAVILLDIFGLFLLLEWLLSAWRGPARSRRFAMACVMAASMYALNFTSLPRLPTIYGRFLWNLPSYQNVVAEVERLRRYPGTQAYEGHDCIVDPGPPLRVAFVWGGIIDNWVGIVYDPTGEVLKANEFRADWSNWDDPRLAPVKGLFGGDLRSTRHLFGPWYYCTFT